MAIQPDNPTATITAAISFGPMSDELIAAAGPVLADPDDGPGRAVVTALGEWINAHPELDAQAKITTELGGAVTLIYEAPPASPPEP